MFYLFKSKKEKLQKKREKLLKEAYRWSAIDRKKSDELYGLAEAINVKLDESSN
jgi:hypothetical protein